MRSFLPCTPAQTPLPTPDPWMPHSPGSQEHLLGSLKQVGRATQPGAAGPRELPLTKAWKEGSSCFLWGGV